MWREEFYASTAGAACVRDFIRGAVRLSIGYIIFLFLMDFLYGLVILDVDL